MASTLHGEALQVVKYENDQTFSLDEELLAKVLLDPRVRNTRVMVVSVAGTFRKGKSFLLNFFLRYLTNQSKDWVGDPSDPLIGFSWKGGSERATTGILLWSEPFYIILPSGEHVCVLLMDTQGAFDSESTVKDCATVFALSTMLSSVQVYNITSNIQEDDLQHLELFTEYGRLAMEATNDKPFQSLHFLVRDWQYPYQHAYGAEGGKQILEKRLQIKEKQAYELQQLRRHLRKCFQNIGCYLMPHPGLQVATSADFSGKLSEIEDDFKEHVKAFIEEIFNPDNVIVKKISGSEITGKELVEYFKAYIKVFQGNDLPEPKSMLEATAIGNNLTAVNRARELYVREMEKVCGGDRPYLNMNLLEKEHGKWFIDSLSLFRTIRKMGSQEFIATYEKQLENDLLILYDTHKKNNQAKSILTTVQTPVFFVLLSLAVYIFSGFFAIAGLETVVRLCNFLMFVSILCLALWSYCRYTGQYRWVVDHMDEATKTCWQFISKKVPGANPATAAYLVSKSALENKMK